MAQVTITITSQGGAQAQEALERVAQTMNQVEGAQASMAGSAGDAAQAEEGLGKKTFDLLVVLGKIVSVYELARFATKHWAAAGQNAATAAKAQAVASASLSKGLRGARNAAVALAPALTTIATVLTALGIGAVAGIAVAGLVKVEKAIIGVARRGAALLPVEGALDNLAEQAGTTGDALVNRLEAATRSTVPRMDLMKNAVLALNSGAVESPAVLAELAESAQVLGQVIGNDTAPALNNLIRGIALRQPQLIKSGVGVMVSAEAAYRNFADSVNKGTSELTEHEEKVAFLEETLRKLRDATENVRTEQDKLNVAFQQGQKAAKDIRDEFSKGAAESDDLTDALLGVQLVLQDLGSDGPGVARAVGRAVANALGSILSMSLGATPIVAQRIEELREQQEILDTIGAKSQRIAEAAFSRALPDRATSEQIAAAEAMIEDALISGVPPEMADRLGERLDEVVAEAVEKARPPVPSVELGDISRAIKLRPTRENLAALTDEAARLNDRLDELKVKAVFEDVSEDVQEVQRRLNRLGPEIQAQMNSAAQRAQDMTVEMAGIVEGLDPLKDLPEETLNEWRRNFMDPFLAEMRLTFDEAGRGVSAIGPPREGGPPSGSDLIEDLRSFGVTPGQALGGFLPAGVRPEDVEAAREALQRQREVEAAWAEFMGTSQSGINEATQVAITGFGSMVEAAIRGTSQMEVTIINSLTRIAQQAANIALQRRLASGGSAGALGFLAPAIGAVGGILSAVFSDRDRPQPVRVDEYGPRARQQMREDSGPDTVTVVVVDSEGEQIERTVKKMNELEARDGVTRLPVGGPGRGTQ